MSVDVKTIEKKTSIVARKIFEQMFSSPSEQVAGKLALNFKLT